MAISKVGNDEKMPFKTILSYGEAVIVEKKSKFIAEAMPVESEDDALIFLDEVRKKYRDASHHVFAYRIGNIERMSDDGEPNGTAGVPILEMLKAEGLNNLIVVVTRYFGGTLLGTGGLVRSYGHSAKSAVLSAQIIEKLLYDMYEVTISYGFWGKLQYEASTKGYYIYKTEFSENVVCTFLILGEQRADFLSNVADISAATANVAEKGGLLCANIDGEIKMI